eukprot:2997779-Amphidinium_carterae.1
MGKEPPGTPKKKETSKPFLVHESPAAQLVRRITRVYMVNGDRPFPPGLESNDPQVNIALADDFVELMDVMENEEDAIRAFLDLPTDNVIKEGMREGLIEYIGTSAKLFVISVKEWRAINSRPLRG